MARYAKPPAPKFPQIPKELASLIDDHGRYRRGGFVPGKHDQDWERFKVLKMKYCSEAHIPLSEFSAVQDQH